MRQYGRISIESPAKIRRRGGETGDAPVSYAGEREFESPPRYIYNRRGRIVKIIAQPKRERRRFWAVYGDGEYVQEIDGLSYGPEHPNIWWCPMIGYSLHYGERLFETELDALDVALSLSRSTLTQLQQRINTLTHRREEIISEQERAQTHTPRSTDRQTSRLR